MEKGSKNEARMYARKQQLTRQKSRQNKQQGTTIGVEKVVIKGKRVSKKKYTKKSQETS